MKKELLSINIPIEVKAITSTQNRRKHIQDRYEALCLLIYNSWLYLLYKSKLFHLVENLAENLVTRFFMNVNTMVGKDLTKEIFWVLIWQYGIIWIICFITGPFVPNPFENGVCPKSFVHNQYQRNISQDFQEIQQHSLENFQEILKKLVLQKQDQIHNTIMHYPSPKIHKRASIHYKSKQKKFLLDNELKRLP